MTKLVGILNVTPDSFATPPLAPEAAATAALEIIADGADVIDVGAESTRPGARTLTPQEEWERLAPGLPAIIAAAHAEGVSVSLDTRNPWTAQLGIAAGVDLINDVSGGGPEMAAIVAPTAALLVVMHALAVPPVAGRMLPPEADPLPLLRDWFEGRLDALDRAGIARDRLVLDPGIGFGKTPRHAMMLISRAAELSALGCHVMVGHSRKSVLGTFTEHGAAPDARDDVTIALSAVMAVSGIDYLRVHAVARHREMLDVLSPRRTARGRFLPMRLT